MTCHSCQKSCEDHSRNELIICYGWLQENYSKQSDSLSKIYGVIATASVYHSELGGRYILELDTLDKEELMYLTTKKRHNSKCPECTEMVSSCLCTTCTIWYCINHISHHKHIEKIQKCI